MKATGDKRCVIGAQKFKEIWTQASGDFSVLEQQKPLFESCNAILQKDQCVGDCIWQN